MIRRGITLLLVVVLAAAGAGTAVAVASALDEAAQSRRAAEHTAERALEALEAEQARARSEADHLAARIDDLADALDQLRDTNALLATDVDRLVRLNETQATELEQLRARVAQLSQLVIDLGGQLPGPSPSRRPSAASTPEPECDGPPGPCRRGRP